MSGSWQDGRRPVTIAILAMGGEGGGVLADWIVALGEAAGHSAQNTSVAGVAQRTGATIYYVELFPPAADGAGPGSGGRAEPVLSMMPTPGEVDIVIASELMEAGRAVQRGFATPDRTTLIASTNRVYSMTERIALGDARVDSAALLAAAGASSKRFIGADFGLLAEQAGSVISASLFGALAGSGALPFERERFEAAISAAGKGVRASLAAFAAGFEAATAAGTDAGGGPSAAAPRRAPVPVSIGPRPPADPAAAAEAETARLVARAAEYPHEFVGPRLAARADRVAAEFPAPARYLLLLGCQRTAVYQDLDYTDRYLDRVARLAACEVHGDGSARLTTEGARHVALWMTYQDTIHVALQKTRAARLQRVRAEAGASAEQLLQVREYLHPRIDEITDTLPTALGRRLAGSRGFRRLVQGLTRDGMVVNTTSVWGYTQLYATARLRPLRPRSLRFGREQQHIERWLELAVRHAATDYDLACEIIACQRVLKGYGQTHQHGSESFAALMAAAERLAGQPGAAARLRGLHEAALADEDGGALRERLAAERVG